MRAILFSIAALFATQVSGASVRDDPANWDDAQQLLTELNDLVRDSTLENLPRLESATVGVNEHVETAASDIEIEINNSVEDIRDQLEELEKRAEAADALQCTGREKDLEASIGVAVSETKRCIREYSEEALSRLDLTINEIKLMSSESLFLAEEVDACRYQYNPDECVGILIEQIHTEILEVPPRIKLHTATTLQIVDTLDGSIDACGVDRADAVVDDGNKIIEEVEACIGGEK